MQQDTFISHLIELRTRLMHALMAVLAAFVVLFLYPGSGPIYDFLAAPLMHALPEGTKMIATGVITPFMVPMKVTALVAFLVALPYGHGGAVLTQHAQVLGHARMMANTRRPRHNPLAGLQAKRRMAPIAAMTATTTP